MTGCAGGCLVVGVALLAASSGCYTSHGRNEVDAGGVVDAPAEDGRCVLRAPTNVYLEPPLPAGHVDTVRVERFEAGPAALGVRFHLDTCPMADTPCPHDAIMVGIGADFGPDLEVPETGGMGFLDWDGERTLHFYVMDIRRCSSCGGDLDVLAGGLESNLSGPEHTGDGEVVCADSCNDYPGVVIESHGHTVSAHQGETVTNGPLTLRVTQDATRACVRCDCTAPDYPASGLFVEATGVFRPGG